MVFWFFKKNSYGQLKKDLETIHTKMHSSFSNVKKDMTNINAWLEEHHSYHEETKMQIADLQKQVNYINALYDDLKYNPPLKEEIEYEEPEEANEEIIETKLPNLETLTHTQKQILYAILALLNETGRKNCSLKEIAEELYREKDYHKIRPMISSYLNHIEELGVISRKRVGKESHVQITEFGKRVINNIKQSKKEQKITRKITK